MDVENQRYSLSEERQHRTRSALTLRNISVLQNNGIEVQPEQQQLKYSPGLAGPTCYLALFLFLCCFSGMLKEWSLVIYGTAEQPYPAHRERARSAEMPTDSDLTEEYSGESCTQTVQTAATCTPL